MSIFVWSMIGIALWHFAIFVPDRFVGGIIGALLAAWGGAFLSGFMFEGFEVPSHNPPGLRHALYALPGSIAALWVSWVVGSRQALTARPAA
jgi:hypothetical protein